MDKTLEFLKKYVNDNDTVVCATSGGSDSMVLLSLLNDLRKTIDFKLICAHVNHKLREESDEEYVFVKTYCDNNNIIFEGTEFLSYNKGNVEAEAHNKRYSFFEEVIQKYNANYLLTAHHGDDLMESILMKITKGVNFNSLYGFDYVVEKENYTILRPLIFYSKGDIRDYASNNNIEYREDKSNSSDMYTRNRYRKNILPFLKNEKNNVHLEYLKFSDELKEYNRIIDNISNKIYSEVVKDNIVNIEKLLKNDIFLVKKVIYLYLSMNLKNNSFIKEIHIDNIVKVINSKSSKKEICLPNDIVLLKEYNELKIKNNVFSSEYKLLLEDKVYLESGYIEKVDQTDLTNNYVCFLNSIDIKLPIYVRNKKDGDRIILLGLNKSKKVKDIFIDEKLENNLRKNYPVVVDSDDNILWIPGLKKSKYDNIKTGKYDIILRYYKEENYE